MNLPASIRPRRVLVVEDDAALQSAYGRYFAKRYELAFAGTGAQALERFQGFAPEVVVLDLHLADTDGVELLHELREAEPTIPIVITSGFTSMLPVVELLGIAHSGYLVKPFDLDTLRACIDAAR